MKKKINLAILGLILFLNGACGGEIHQETEIDNELKKVELSIPDRLIVKVDSIVNLAPDYIGENLSYKWLLDKSVISQEPSARITLNTVGEKELNVEVTDKAGNMKVITKSILVTKNKEKEILGYVPHYRDTYPIEHWLNKVTILAWAFARVTDGGNLDMMLSAAQKETLKNIIKQAHGAGIRVILSIGHGRDAQKPAFSYAVLNPNQRTVIVTQGLSLMNEYGFDGIDVDFEGWSNSIGGTDAEKAKGLNSLWKQFREKLPVNYTLSAALSMIQLEKGLYTSEMLKMLDYCNIMSYDKTGPWSSKPGSHSPYDYFTKGVELVLARGIPKEKILPGIPFYGMKFKSATSTEGAYQMSWKNIVLNYPKAIYNNEILEDFLYYDGPPKVKKKAQYIINQNIGGAMIWELTQDYYDDTSKSLLNILHNELKM